jgi:hypothetical protein
MNDDNKNTEEEVTMSFNDHVQEFLTELDGFSDKVAGVTDEEMEKLIESYVTKAADAIIRNKRLVTRMARKHVEFCVTVCHSLVGLAMTLRPMAMVWFKTWDAGMNTIIGDVVNAVNSEKGDAAESE